MKVFPMTKTDFDHFLRSIFNSYSQVFFSDHRGFATLLIVISFFDPFAGLAGLLAVITTSIVGFALNFDRSVIAKGLYGFNSLLTGLGLGVYYYFSPHLVFIIIIASIFSLFVSVSLQGVIGKYHLPFLSFPFLLTIWAFFMASSNFTVLGINERGIYTLNEFYALGGLPLVRIYESFSALPMPEIPKSFLVSLSAIFFQYNIIAGIVIALGLLWFSRIGFTLAVLGFLVAWTFYSLIGVQINSYDYSYIGFNYILTSIAVGGFFLIPSKRSYLSVVVLIPMVAVITLSLSGIFYTFRLPLYSLPFTLVTLLYLYILKFRVDYSHKLSEVFFQFNSPEKNLYTFYNKIERFRYHHLIPVKLPFWGTWQVSQAHDGEYTHQDKWKHAFDFVIVDNENKQFSNKGNYAEDYYCFNKPVIAPADGVVEKVTNDIEDNVIGQVNLKDNWGNTVILKHDDHTYSKLSHLKKDSIEVKEGDKVTAGQMLGRCGNSGRSPYPHLHFQMQENPWIGSFTMDYPFMNYIKHNPESTDYMSYARPHKDDLVSNVDVNELLKNAFQLVPGQLFNFKIKENNKEIGEVTWEVKVNPLNQSYLYCRETRSLAYFENHESLFYFTQFYGDRNGFLYEFFLGAYKIQKGFYKNLEINDSYPLHLHFPKKYLWFQDFISPFKIFTKSVYLLQYSTYDNSFDQSSITLNSNAINKILKKEISRKKYSIKITEFGLCSFTIFKPDKKLTLERCADTV